MAGLPRWPDPDMSLSQSSKTRHAGRGILADFGGVPMTQNPARLAGLPLPAGVKLGIGLTSPSPELAQICAHAGFDRVLIDMEHGPIDFETCYRMVTAMKGSNAQAWVRVAANDPTLIKRALDAGATDILVPMVNTRQDAERAVAAAKYPPDGIRGWGPFRTQYQWNTDMADYTRRANAQTRVHVLIEHPVAVANIDAILEVKGLAGVLPVPFDLAVNMGYPDGPQHPAVREVLGAALGKVGARGFPVMAFAVTPEQGRAALDSGATFLFLGFDTMFVPAALQLYLAQLSRAAA